MTISCSNALKLYGFLVPTVQLFMTLHSTGIPLDTLHHTGGDLT